MEPLKRKDERAMFTLRLDPELNRQVEHLVIDLNTTKTAFIIEAVEEKLKRELKRLRK